MRQLLPTVADDVDPVDVYLRASRPLPADRPWVTVGMISSADGATAVDGRSGALGGAGDRAVFWGVRAVADVIVVASGTARAENYRPIDLPAPIQDARRAQGRPANPRLALVMRHTGVDPDHRVFGGDDQPLVLAPIDAPADRLDRLRDVAEVATFGTGGLDLRAALAHLRERYAVAVVEGGPTLNGLLHEAGVIDEWCLTLAPIVVGGASHRIVADAAAQATRHRLAGLLADDDDYLFARYVRAG